MKRSTRSPGALIAPLVFMAVLGCKPPSSAPAPTPESLLRGALEYFESLAAGSVRADVAMQVKEGEQDHVVNSTASLRFKRPDKFALVADGGIMGISYISDGKQAVTYLPMLNRYTITETDDKDATGGMTSGAKLAELAQAFDANKVYAELSKRITSSEYLGLEPVDGIDCHHCRYDSAMATVDVWFDAGTRPLVRKIAPDLTKILARQAASNAAMGETRIEWVVTFKDWDTAAQLNEADFVFTPPAGAEKVDTLMGAGRGAQPLVHPLVGQPAPPFDVPGLDGKTVDLANYLGKNVIVLDFWATWCGPCVAALPEVGAVTAALKDRGVVFYAVNIGEEKDAVTEFLAAQKLDVPVALDVQSTVAAAYRVTGIPQTVLIGKDGKVQVVYVGFGANLNELLTHELDELLAGKDLAAGTLAEAAKQPPADAEAAD